MEVEQFTATKATESIKKYRAERKVCIEKYIKDVEQDILNYIKRGSCMGKNRLKFMLNTKLKVYPLLESTDVISGDEIYKYTDLKNELTEEELTFIVQTITTKLIKEPFSYDIDVSNFSTFSRSITISISWPDPE